MPDEHQQRDWYRDIATSYDAIAELYAADYADELSRKPFDRELLAQFAELICQGGRVCDMGCGPGHLARHLAELGLDAMGVDVSPAMLEVARRLNPNLRFEHSDMLRLPFPDGNFAGIAAFYSIIHIERLRVTDALGELFRVLQSGGHLLLSFHVGEGEVHRDEYYSQSGQKGPPIAFHATLFAIDEMEGYLEDAGFQVEESLDREAYEFEYPTRRAYILARRSPVKANNGP
jgi:ubiquinone/menaquinone biosynthesis C-methylase UbiE